MHQPRVNNLLVMARPLFDQCTWIWHLNGRYKLINMLKPRDLRRLLDPAVPFVDVGIFNSSGMGQNRWTSEMLKQFQTQSEGR